MSSSAPDLQTVPPPGDDTSAAFNAMAPQHRAALLQIRSLIFDVARETEGVGEITETLKWGQPSYAPAKPRIGSSVRLGVSKSGHPALFFICHSGLVDRFRELYEGQLRFEGNRAILLPSSKPVPEKALRHCIAMTLTWHIKKS